MKDDNDSLLDGTLPSTAFDDTEPLLIGVPGANGGGDDDWGEPIPIGPAARAPVFPVEVLPAWLRHWVAALAEALQCPLDLPAMLALAVLSLSCAKKFCVQVRPDWAEPLNLYIAVALRPGESKSPAFLAATRPVAQYVAVECKRRSPEIRAAVARADVAQKRIDLLKARAAKTADAAEHAKMLAVIEEAVFEHAAMEIPVPPRLIVDDVTAESLEVVLRQQGGRIGIFSDEGGPFELMGGRYSDNVPNIDIYLKGHSGSPISTDRIGREGGTVRNPAITIGLAVQPEVLTSLQGKRGFRGRGLLARFLWVIPRSRVGERSPDSPGVPEGIRDAYAKAVTALLEITADRDELGEVVSRAIELSPEAYALLVEFKGAIEPSLGPSGELESIADWGNKLAGTAIRLAGLLHLADRSGENADSLTEPVGEEEMRRALALADYLTAHARIAFDMMSADPVARDARHILAWIQRMGAGTFTRREAYQILRTRFRNPAEMDPPLDLLVEHEVLRRRPDPPRRGPGRPPSPTFDVNPAIHTRNSQNAGSLQSPGDFVNSVNGPGARDAHASTLSRSSGDGYGGGC